MNRRLWIACSLVGLSGLSQAQLLPDANWQEGPVPEPPAFSLERLIRFEVQPNSALVYAVDPQTIQIAPGDRVVRYVVVASSPSGARNVLYEGIRCPTAEVKTYARHNGQQWVRASDPQWQPMSSRPSPHAFQLARQGACEQAGTPLRADDVVRALKAPGAALR